MTTSDHAKPPVHELTGINTLFPGLNGHGPKPSNLLSDLDSLIDNTPPFLPNHPTDQTHPLRLFRIDSSTGEYHIHSDGFPDDLGQSLSTSRAWDDSEGDLGLAEDGGRGGEEDIAHHGQFTTSSELDERRNG